MIFLDTNILYHILHRTPRTEEALAILDENPGEYVVDMIVHNEVINAIRELIKRLNIRLIPSIYMNKNFTRY